jgi:hypothetical protein
LPLDTFSQGLSLSIILITVTFKFFDPAANYIGLHPRPYLVYQPRLETRTEDGINFANGGVGVFPSLGFTKTGDQIGQLKALINVGEYTSTTVYNQSLILYTISSNDHSAFFLNSLIIDILVIFNPLQPKQMIKVFIH